MGLESSLVGTNESVLHLGTPKGKVLDQLMEQGLVLLKASVLGRGLGCGLVDEMVNE